MENNGVLAFVYNKHNSKGTMLEERIGSLKNKKIVDIFTKGMLGNLFYYEDELHAVGLKNRFEWPTNTTVLRLSQSGKVSFKYKLFDRNIIKATVHESILYFLYEDSGKTLLQNANEKIDLIDENITIKDFVFSDGSVYVIANSFSNPDEVYELIEGKLNKISKANNFFVKNIKTRDCIYERINTGKSEIDTWGVFVGKDKPTILNIHGGPASQYLSLIHI